MPYEGRCPVLDIGQTCGGGASTRCSAHSPPKSPIGKSLRVRPCVPPEQRRCRRVIVIRSSVGKVGLDSWVLRHRREVLNKELVSVGIRFAVLEVGQRLEHFELATRSDGGVTAGLSVPALLVSAWGFPNHPRTQNRILIRFTMEVVRHATMVVVESQREEHAEHA